MATASEDGAEFVEEPVKREQRLSMMFEMFQKPEILEERSKLLGTWYYEGKGRDFQYSVLQTGNEMQFVETQGKKTVTGKLEPEGQWMVAPLKTLDGKNIGTIRLRFHEGKVVSNFLKVGKDEWSPDSAATSFAEQTSQVKIPNSQDSRRQSELAKSPREVAEAEGGGEREEKARTKTGSPVGTNELGMKLARQLRKESTGESAVDHIQVGEGAPFMTKVNTELRVVLNKQLDKQEVRADSMRAVDEEISGTDRVTDRVSANEAPDATAAASLAVVSQAAESPASKPTVESAAVEPLAAEPAVVEAVAVESPVIESPAVKSVDTLLVKQRVVEPAVGPVVVEPLVMAAHPEPGLPRVEAASTGRATCAAAEEDLRWIGTWHYLHQNRTKGLYVIERKDGELYFHESNGVQTISGKLKQDGEYKVGQLAMGEGKAAGAVRMMLQSGAIVSCFKAVGQKTWPEDTKIIASPTPPPGMTDKVTAASREVDAAKAVPKEAAALPAEVAGSDFANLPGVWRYKHWSGKKGKYMVAQKGDKMYFKEGSGAASVQGRLQPSGQWMVARLQLVDGKEVGTVRLTYRAGTVVSNFKALGDDDWRDDTAIVATRVQDESSQAVVPVKLAGDHAKFLGTWRYLKNCKYFEYRIEPRGADIFFVKGTGKDQKSGKLASDGQWVTGTLRFSSGRDVGIIRLMWSWSDRTMVSNFMKVGEKTWGEDMIATRLGDHSHTTALTSK